MTRMMGVKCVASATRLTLTKEEKDGLVVMVLVATDGFTIGVWATSANQVQNHCFCAMLACKPDHKLAEAFVLVHKLNSGIISVTFNYIFHTA